MSIKATANSLEWWANRCDRTNRGCCAKKTLEDAVTLLRKLEKRLQNEAAREVCHFCGAEKCVGRDNCPSITEWVRRVTNAEG